MTSMKPDSVAGLWFALVLTDLRLKLVPHRFNRTLLLADPPTATPQPVEAESAARHAEILVLANLVRRAARHRFIFNMSCLRQALVLRARLRARGIPASLVYGARKGAAGFGAHAWVESGGMRLDGAPEQQFHRFKN